MKVEEEREDGRLMEEWRRKVKWIGKGKGR